MELRPDPVGKANSGELTNAEVRPSDLCQAQVAPARDLLQGVAAGQVSDEARGGRRGVIGMSLVPGLYSGNRPNRVLGRVVGAKLDLDVEPDYNDNPI
jgi:hypothetical protein